MEFSVIVPVYKVGAYLKKCVDSILKQTFENFELILVDDGSPDKCPGICDEYAEKDERVKVIHKENEGVVNARKSGLLASKGKYIVFVDGDDWIAPQFLERGHKLMEETYADMICFACSKEHGKYSEIWHEPVEEGVYEGAAIQNQLYPVLLLNSQMKHLFYYVFGKVFCRKLAEQCFLTIDENISFGEDVLCIVPAYLNAKKVFISHEVMTFYRMREQSGSHGFRIKHYQQLSMVLKELKNIEKDACELPKDYNRQIERYGAHICFVLMIHGVNDGEFKRLKEIKWWMNQPLLKESIKKAEFKGITLKTRITYTLFRRNLVLFSYLFLQICQGIKDCQERFMSMPRNG